VLLCCALESFFLLTFVRPYKLFGVLAVWSQKVYKSIGLGGASD
jgi:hypothetical protein